MNGLCITDAVKQFKITSKTLRYYEHVGLLEASRVENNYRFYNESEVERIKQILILRKMQISIKDIIRIYENKDMSTVVEVFVNRINSIDADVGALIELRRITNNFLQTMVKNGITKISAIPLLYEEMDKQLSEMEERKPVTMAELNDVSKKLAKPVNTSIITLPTMRVLSSVRKGSEISDADAFWDYTQKFDIPIGLPGRHELFEYQTNEQTVFIQKINNDFENDSPFTDYIFDGGFFVTTNVYLDEDLGERFHALIKDFDDNKYYQIDYKSDGNLRHAAMLENLISTDDQREIVCLFVPVKKRMADPALFDKPVEVTDISVAEIEAANPVLWTVEVPLDKLIPINNPHYQVTEQGEAEYIAWISTRVLSTNIEVKLPFRVDIEFRLGEGTRFGYGATEGSVCMYHGNHDKNHNYVFGVNMDNAPATPLIKNANAIIFHQPVFRDVFKFLGRGKIIEDGYNKLSWIIGEKHLACIINGEVRYCATNFPYMKLDLSREEARPIVIGSDGQGKKYFRSIRISQLTKTTKTKIKEGELTMITKRSNNIIPVIHRLITDEYGENYWFNGCARYVMECLGEYTADSDLMTDDIKNGKLAGTDLGYWLFAGLTGDIFAQHYKMPFSGDAVSAHYHVNGDTKFFEDIFAKVGYAAKYVLTNELCENKEMYLQTLMAYIDKGVPVITMGHGGISPFGVIVGYEENGNTLLYITGNKNEPERISFEDALSGCKDNSGWIFVGEKKETRPLAEVYREAIYALPKLLTINNDKYCFGAAAFRAWADDIEKGYYKSIKPDKFDHWGMYTNFVCVLATNGSCVHNFLWRAKILNPDMTFLDNINKLYERTAQIWNNDSGEDLEALGGGFNVTLEILQNKEKRKKIAAKIYECADCIDDILLILQQNI